MATYDEWNKAIAEYFVSGLSSGSTVYLSVDEDALMDIGRQFEQSEPDTVDWVEDFRKGVISKCVAVDEVKLPRRAVNQSDHVPTCVAFLAAMVLAAHHMIKEDTKSIAENDYFKRLREVLGIPIKDGGRPEGILPAGVEEELWQIWNIWLIGNSWLPSAERGQHSQKFINYPLSQALLRDSDKRTIEIRFREKEQMGELGRVSDRDTIGFWVRRQQFGSTHLREMIQESDFRRYEAVTDAVFEVYTSIDWDQDFDATKGIRRISKRRMTANLYRVENIIIEKVEYNLYPRQPRQFGGGSLQVVHNSRIHLLQEERQGWFMPLKWKVDPAGDVTYEVRGHPQIKELILPKRDFWILVRDPENATSGVFAEWGPPGLGETFILLCKKEYEEQMELFKQEALLEWDQVIPIDEEWVEYQECMITSQSWEGIIPQHQDLHDALKPSNLATISLKGGLRVPNQNGWLEGYTPEVTIFAFDDSVHLKLLDTSLSHETIMDQLVDTNKVMSVPNLDPGVYLFEAYSFGQIVDRRSLRILSWDSLDCPQPNGAIAMNVETFIQQGAVIKMNQTSNSGEE